MSPDGSAIICPMIEPVRRMRPWLVSIAIHAAVLVIQVRRGFKVSQKPGVGPRQ
jgi:hypothetical protein